MSRNKVLILSETTAQSLIRDAGTFAMFAALIGIGIVLESDAMQWVGGFVGFLALFARAANSQNYLTIEQARKRLDEIEAAK